MIRRFLFKTAVFFFLAGGNVIAADQTWSLIEERYAGINTGGWSVPALADIDADGDLDMLLGGWRDITFYRNDGNPKAPSWTLITNSYADIELACASPNLVDIDSDGDFDLFVSGCSGGKEIYFYRNDGTPQTPLWTYVPEFDIYTPHPGCSHIATFADIDGDEDLDIFLGECDWTAHYIENIGSKYSPQFRIMAEDFIYENFGIWYGNYIAFEDVDLDDDLDMFVGIASMPFIRNNGNKFYPHWELETLAQRLFPTNQYYNFPVFVDIDDDGRKEIIMGNDRGYVSYYDSMPQAVTVEIDIKPGSYPNSINLGSKGVVPVAVLSTDDFDATAIDAKTVVFAGAHAIGGNLEDINGDGRLDMVFHFNTQDLMLDSSNVSTAFAGSTDGGMSINGEDSVNIVPNGR
jgi:hypothetical protein